MEKIIKDVFIGFRTSKEQKDILQKEADTAMMSLSNYISLKLQESPPLTFIVKQKSVKQPDVKQKRPSSTKNVKQSTVKPEIPHTKPTQKKSSNDPIYANVILKGSRA